MSDLFAATNRPTTLPVFAGQLEGQASAPAEPLSLWYREPATVWTSALPVGNGRQGAMIFGGISSEILCLNEATLWSGGPYDPINPASLEALPEVRQLVWDGKYDQANKLISQKMMAKPLTQMPYQPVGDVLLSFGDFGRVENYRRDLNLATAVAAVEFGSGGVNYKREMFVSAPDNVLVLRLTADRPGQINFRVGLRTDQNIAEQTPATADSLILNGVNRSNAGVKGALKFQCRVRILHEGGSLTLTPWGSSGTAHRVTDEISLAGADRAVVLIASATSYVNFHDVSGDPDAKVSGIIDHAASKGYDALLKDHLADYEKLFSRVSLDLGGGDAAHIPTDQRIANFSRSGDPALAALYYQYGRYLLISSSRFGGQAANLQGLWNDLTNPPWGSKYTININTEMNYWLANNCNLGECVEPLLGMVEDLAVSGEETARKMYGARGWVVHHNTDLWRASAPIDGPLWGMWPTGGAWLCNTLWDHYEFTDDRDFLRRLYPLMKGPAQFFLDTLVEEPRHHWLVTNPSLSPENSHHPGASITDGPTMDMQILRDLFAHCIEAAKTLGVDQEFSEQLATARAGLAPNQIGSAGQLQEWIEDWDMQAPEPHHRHVSHLYGFFPGEDISFEDKALADAVRKSLEFRGDDATGWGLAWRLNLWARLHDGAHAYKILENLLAAAKPHADSRERSGVYNNLFDAHPPFQIDGNLGGSAGIAEMLLQSTAARADRPVEIELLPALPPQWPSGQVAGLRARGNYEVSIAWKAGKLLNATVKNDGDARPVQLRCGDKTVTVEIEAGQSRTFDEQLK